MNDESALQCGPIDKNVAKELYARLTNKEREACWCVVLGYTRTRAAILLDVKPRTVDSTIDRAKHKLRCRTVGIPLIMLVACGLGWPKHLE